MIQAINGITLGQVNITKGADNALNIVGVSESTGAPIDITGATVALLVYSAKNKGGTLTSVAGTLGTVAGGHFTIALADDQAVISTYVVGTSLFAYAKVTESGGTIHIAENPVVLKVV